MENARRVCPAPEADQCARPVRGGVFQGNAGHDQGQERQDQQDVHDPVKRPEALHVVALALVRGWLARLLPRVFFRPGLAPPQDGMGPEEKEHPDDEDDHEDVGHVQDGVLVRVFIVRVRYIVREFRMKATVASAAHGRSSLRRKVGFRVVPRQNIVRNVAVGAAGYLFGLPHLEDFAVVCRLVMANYIGRQFVAFHQSRVVMAGDAPGSVIDPCLGRALRAGLFECRDAVQAVAVRAGGSIVVPPQTPPRRDLWQRILPADGTGCIFQRWRSSRPLWVFAGYGFPGGSPGSAGQASGNGHRSRNPARPWHGTSRTKSADGSSSPLTCFDRFDILWQLRHPVLPWTELANSLLNLGSEWQPAQSRTSAAAGPSAMIRIASADSIAANARERTITSSPLPIPCSRPPCPPGASRHPCSPWT